MSEIYKYWMEALASRKPEAFVDSPQAGFYRMKRGDQWIPVAVWPSLGGLGFKIGKEVVGTQNGIEAWSRYCNHPISEKVYRAVAEDGENWPDEDPTVADIVAMLEIGKAGEIREKINVATIGAVLPSSSNTLKIPAGSFVADHPIDELREKINVARKGTAAYAKIEANETAARAAGLRNMLLKLSGDADKARVAEKAPYLKAEREIDAKWKPLINDADASAKELKSSLDDWEDTKREAARRVAAKAAEEASKHAEAVAAAEAANQPAPPPPPPQAAPNVPAPAAQIRPTYGRATHVGTKMVVTAVDWDKMIAAVKLRAEWPTLQEFLQEMAQKLANRGVILDGVTAEERANTK